MIAMKTFVTGANGLLGASLVRELLRRGHQVRALVRKDSNLAGIRGLDIELYYGDLDDESRLAEACRGFDHVIHAAARTPGHQTRFRDFAKTNIRGTQNMIRAAEREGISRMVYVSSCCIFSGGSPENPGTELSEFTGFRFNSGYINSKYLAHQWVLAQIEQRKLPIVIVNPTLMIGPYDARPSTGETILRIIRQPLQLCPSGGKNFVDVRDAAAAACNALTRGIYGESYLLAGENLSFHDLFAKVNTIYGRPGFRMPMPTCLMKLAGLVGSAIQAASGKDIPLNFSNARQLSCCSYFSGAKAARVLAMPQRPVDNAIRDAIGWFIEHGYLASPADTETLIPVPAYHPAGTLTTIH
jgi:dihydroflavonol-4-reductase